MSGNKHLHLEPVGGVAGDMFVAAMLDAFPQCAPACMRDLEAADLMQHVSVELQTGKSKGLAVKRLRVYLNESPAKRTGNYRDLRQWLTDSALSVAVKSHAQKILEMLADAEACVHGVDIDDVHFHEVADWDSLVDIVAAASVIENCGVNSWSCARLPLGSGLVSTEHGQLPVPAPATSVLLKGLAVWDDGEVGERVTPTGAAIVRYLLTDVQGKLKPDVQKPQGLLLAVGSGAGQRELRHRPNLLRCLVMGCDETVADRSQQRVKDPLQAQAWQQTDQVVLLGFDIDDMTPEELSVSLDHIRRHESVLDASFHLAQGKKGRPVFCINILCVTDQEVSVSDLCFSETTTLGLRIQTVNRRTLKRSLHTVSDEMGEATIKSAQRSSQTTAKLESDDLSAIPGLQARRRRARQLQQAFET